MIGPPTTTPTYEDLTISIERDEEHGASGRRWMLRAVEASRFTKDFTPRPFRIPVTADEVERALSDIASTSRPWVQRSGPGQALDPVKDIGSRLFTALLEAGLDSVYRLTRSPTPTPQDVTVASYTMPNSAAADAQNAEAALRLRIVMDDPELEAIPWEFLFDVARQDFLVLVRRVTLARQRGGQSPDESAPRIHPPLRVLIVDATTGENGAKEEIAAVRSLAPNPSLVEIEELRSHSPTQLLSELREREFHILHFIGSGRSNQFESGPSRQMLMLPVDDDAGAQIWAPLSTRRLAGVLQDRSDLQLVYLSACHSDHIASELSLVVPSVIGMRGAISVDACKNFTDGLYRAFLAGQPLDVAVAHARQTIDLNQPGAREWGRTLLYMRPREGAQLMQTPTPDAPTRKLAPDEETPAPIGTEAHRAWKRLSALLAIQQQNLVLLEDRKRQSPNATKFFQLQIDETTARIDALKQELTGDDGQRRCDSTQVKT